MRTISGIIERVDDTEQWGDKLWRLTAPGMGSICVDAFGRRPQPGDTVLCHMDGPNFVTRTEVIPKDVETHTP